MNKDKSKEYKDDFKESMVMGSMCELAQELLDNLN